MIRQSWESYCLDQTGIPKPLQVDGGMSASAMRIPSYWFVFSEGYDLSIILHGWSTKDAFQWTAL